MMAELPHHATSTRRPTPMTRFCSIFNQLLQLFPRTEFQRAVQATRAERHARGFTCWDQFVAMLFAQLGRRIRCAKSVAGWGRGGGNLGSLGGRGPPGAGSG